MSDEENVTVLTTRFTRCRDCPSNQDPNQSFDPYPEHYVGVGGVRFRRPTRENPFTNLGDPRIGVQWGVSSWLRDHCGVFSNGYDGNTVLTQYIDTRLCSGEGECEEGFRPQYKIRTTHTIQEKIIDGEPAGYLACNIDSEIIQDCSESLDCVDPTNYEPPPTQVLETQTAIDQWNQYNSSTLENARGYVFRDLLTPTNVFRHPYNTINGELLRWTISKRFRDPDGDLVYIEGAKPKMVARVVDLIIGFEYTFGYDVFYREPYETTWTRTKKRESFVATETSKDFGQILENPSGNYKSDFNNMGNLLTESSYETDEGTFSVGNFGVILKRSAGDNCQQWK